MVGTIAAAWGFAEATLFFLVPDIYLSLVAVRDAGAGFRGCIYAVAGALAGGAVMYAWGSRRVAAAERVLESLPAVDAAMVDGVRSKLTASGLGALFLGPLVGVPYKIYAVESGALGVGIVRFLLVSVPARGIRFMLVTGLAAWVAHQPLRAWSVGQKWTLALALWACFYVIYFAVKGRGGSTATAA